MIELSVATGQSVVAGLGCFGLFLLWRRFAKENNATLIVAVGFLARACLSTVLFWISWLGLPFGKSFQIGNGLWFFGLDGRSYFIFAERLIERGAGDVIIGDRFDAAFVYVQVIAIARVMFGSPMSVALIVNLASFIAAALLIAKWGNQTRRPKHALIALIGLSFDPSFIIWSTQPLKETLFGMLVVLFAYSLRHWVSASEFAGKSVYNVATLRLALVLACVVYLVGGIRWQYGIVLWVYFAAVAIWSVFLSKERRIPRMAISAGAIAMVSAAFALSRPGSLDARLAWFKGLPSWLVRHVQDTRTDFEQFFPASTTIEAGPLIDAAPHSDVLARVVLAILPRFIADAFGVATAHGGRGLWLLAEVDTLFFLGFTFVVIRLLWKNRPLHLMRNPVLGFLLGLLLVSLPLLYVVNNFGSLVRYRMMMMLPTLLLPLAVKPVGEDNEPPSTRAPSLKIPVS